MKRQTESKKFFFPVNPRTGRNSFGDELDDAKITGEPAHGQKLPGETRMAERLGVGRSSVREALKQLAAAGYIELVPNRGAFAVVTSRDEMPSPKDGAVNWLSVNRDSVNELMRVRSARR